MQKSNSFILNVLKSVAISILTALVLILLFAFLIKVLNVPYNMQKFITCIVKIIAVFVGCFTCINSEKGFIKGLISGCIALLLAYVLFGILSGNLTLNLGVLWDILLGATVGAGTGILAVNVKNKNA